MDLQTTNRRIGLAQTIFDDFDERPVDCDFVLPDFLPDIAAIMKCTLHPTVQTYQISGDRLSVDGTVRIHILYLDEERRCVRCFEHTQPFNSEFTVKGLTADCMIALHAAPNYVNCRATGPRRVDIHGAFSVKLTVTGKTDTTVVETAEGDGLHTKSCAVRYTVPSMGVDKAFTLNEVLELEGEDTAQTVIRYDARICLDDCKQLVGKAVVKGDLLLNTVYITDTESGSMRCVKHRIPFSQIVDVDGMDENTLCDYRAEVLSAEVQPIQNPNGENRLLSVSVKVALHAQCYQTDACNVVCDAFHTQYPLNAPLCRLETQCMTEIRKETVTARQTVALPDSSVAQVLDMWCAPLTVQVTDGTITGRSTVCLLVRDESGTVSYFERPIDCELPMTVDGDCTVSATLLDTEYTVSGEQIELRLQIVIKTCPVAKQPIRAITDIQMDETAPYPCAEGMETCQVKILFANAGDSVWEIAKAEHVSPAHICEENELTEDTVQERTALLIPLR